MDFSDLPLEIQSEYLLTLPYQDVLRYCQASKTAQQICENPIFWKQKALLDFKIPLEYAPEAPTLAQRYALLKKQYDRAYEGLLKKLIRGGLLPQALELYSRFTPDYEDEYEIMDDILMAAVETGRPDILSAFAQKIVPAHGYINLAREPYLQAIRMNRPDLAQILSQYYSLKDDPELPEVFYSQIAAKDFPMVKYLRPLVRRDPEFELQTAFESSSPEIIEYFLEEYPHLLRDPVVVNGLAQTFVSYGNSSALRELISRAGRLIDLNALRRNSWVNRYPQIRSLLESL